MGNVRFVRKGGRVIPIKSVNVAASKAPRSVKNVSTVGRATNFMASKFFSVRNPYVLSAMGGSIVGASMAQPGHKGDAAKSGAIIGAGSVGIYSLMEHKSVRSAALKTLKAAGTVIRKKVFKF